MLSGERHGLTDGSSTPGMPEHIKDNKEHQVQVSELEILQRVWMDIKGTGSEVMCANS